MRWAVTIAAVLLVASVRATAGDSYASAWLARQLLGPQVWSQIVEIENDNPGRPYPARFHGLIFELEDALWFYCDTNGTQSLSSYRGRIAQQKSEIAKMLGGMEPAIRSIRTVSGEEHPGAVPKQLPAGCFVESVAWYLDSAGDGRRVTDARLLAYYYETGRLRCGHTVLVFRENGRDWFFDGTRYPTPRAINAGPDSKPLEIAAEIFDATGGRELTNAMLLPLRDRSPELVVAATAADTVAGRSETVSPVADTGSF